MKVCKKLRFRDGLVWTVGLTVEKKLRFHISPAQPRSQGLSSLPPLAFQRPREAKKRDPGNEVVSVVELTESSCTARKVLRLVSLPNCFVVS